MMRTKRRPTVRRKEERSRNYFAILLFVFVLVLEHNYDLIARVGIAMQSIAWAIFYNDEEKPLRP